MAKGKAAAKELEFKNGAAITIDAGIYSISARALDVISDIIITENGSLIIENADLKFAPGAKITCRGVIKADSSSFAGTEAGEGARGSISLLGEKTSGSFFLNCRFKSLGTRSQAAGESALAINGASRANIKIEKCHFSGCSAWVNGGAIFCRDSFPAITGCTFNDCMTLDPEGSGGAVYLSDSSAKISDCSFSGCRTGAGLHYTGGGGAIFCADSNPSIENCNFTACESEGHGGAVCCYNHSSAEISFATFEKCAATKKFGVGGAVYCDSHSSAVISSSVFSACSSIVRGGAAGFSHASNASITSCKFIDCSAVSKEFGVGGAVYCYNSSPGFVKCSFISCTTNGRGGAIYCDCRSNAAIESCSFDKCSSDDAGGAIFYDTTAPTKILSPEFTGCKPNNVNREKVVSGRIDRSVKMAGSTTNHCFIATAACGRMDAPEVIALKKFRDEVLSRNAAGRFFIEAYYKISPPFARAISRSDSLRRFARRYVRSLARFISGDQNL